MVEVRLVVDLPVPAHGDLAVADGEHVARQELANALEKRLAAQAELEAEVVLQSVDIGLHRGQERDQRFDLAREIEDAVDFRVVERLDAKPVAGAKQRVGRFVPQREREHAAEFLEAFDAPLLVRPQRDLGVRGGAEPAATKLGSQLDVVVDLAVVGDPAAVAVGHGLVAGREVDDGQAAVRETDVTAIVFPGRVAVRAAMDLHLVHQIETAA